jgi:hypothetical protein
MPCCLGLRKNMDYNYNQKKQTALSTPEIGYDKKSSKVLSQWFYLWLRTKILFVESKPIEMSN